MANPPTPQELRTFNQIWKRLCQLVGIGSDEFPTSLFPMSSTEPITLYVDGTTGNDSNFGTLASPLRQIQTAIDKVPKELRHLYTISVAAGNYNGFIVEGFNIYGGAAGALSGLNIQGTYAVPTLTTDQTSGTFSSTVTGSSATATFTVCTDATQNWTVNELQGKLLHITSSTGIGNMFPIVSNTATTVTTSSVNAVGATSTYIIKDCTSIVTGSVRSMPALPTSTAQAVSTGQLGSIHFINNQSSTLSTTFRIEGLRINPADTTNTVGVNIQGTPNITVARCQILQGVAAGYTGVNMNGPGTQTLQQSYVSCPTGTSYLCSSGVRAATVSNCWLRGVSAGFTAANSVLSFTACNIEGISSSFGIATNPLGPFQLNITGCKFFGNTSQTVRIPIGGNGTSGFSTINIAGMTSANGGTCIEVFGPHYVNIVGLVSTGSTTGIDAYMGARVRIDATSTITAGTDELRLDSVASTLAVMRAASPKQVSNALHTIIHE